MTPGGHGFARPIDPGLMDGPEWAETMVGARRAVRWALQHQLPRVLLTRAARSGDPSAGILIGARTRSGADPTYDLVRARGRLVRSLVYTTASYDVAKEIFRRDEFGVGAAFSAYPRPLRKVIEWSTPVGSRTAVDPPSMLGVDAPDHTRYRRLVSNVFTPRAIERLRYRIEEIAGELLDDLASRNWSAGPVDLVGTYTNLLPVSVIADILGVPLSERDQLVRFGELIIPCLEKGLTWTEYRRVDRTARVFNEWLAGHLNRLRRKPGDNLMSQLVEAADGGAALTDLELHAVAGLLLGAGFVTAAAMLSTGAHLFMRHPDQLAVVRAEPPLWANAVDETLRLESPLQMTSRTAMSATEVDGVALARGARIVLFVAGANRDPEVFDDPDRFDVRRANARDHLSFAAGRHFCVGAGLARAEGAVGLRLLFERFPDLAPAAEPVRRPTRVLSGWDRMPVVLSR